MSDLATRLRPHVCFYASFDRGLEADVCRGSKIPSCNARTTRFDASAGRFGGAAVFDAADHGWAEDELTWPAEGNFPYSTGEFGGTVSLWLLGDPDADLNDAYPVDPFHISRHPADGSFYLDLTRPNDDRYGSPRKLRWGIYGDSPVQDKFYGGQLMVVGDLGFGDRGWHHVAATWQHANSGASDGAAAVYVDGVRRGWMEGYEHRLTWEIEDLRIGLGQRYAGAIDEVLILDRALSAAEVDELYRQPGPLDPAGG